MQHTKLNLPHQGACVKKTKQKPFIYHNKLQLDTSYGDSLPRTPHYTRRRIESSERIQQQQVDRAMYKEMCYDRVKSLTHGAKKAFAYIVMLKFKRKFKRINPFKGTIATETGFCLKTAERGLKDARTKGLISWVSGKSNWVANNYGLATFFYDPIGIKYTKKAIGHIVNELSQSQCRTYYDYYLKKHKQNKVEIGQQVLKTGEGRSPEPVFSPQSETNHFFRRKRGKVRVSDNDMLTTSASVVDKSSATERGNQKSVICKGIVLENKPLPSNNAMLGWFKDNDHIRKALADE